MSPEVPDPAEWTTPVPEPAEGTTRVPGPAEGTTPVPEPVEGTERGIHPSRFDGPGDRFHPSPLPLVLFTVFAAGVLGTAARLGLDAVIPPGRGGIPLSTLLINAVGSFLLGLVVTAVPHSAPEWLRAGVTTGLLGSFTTFSAITVAAVALPGAGGAVSAVTLVAVSILAGFAAAVAGIALGAARKRRVP